MPVRVAGLGNLGETAPHPLRVSQLAEGLLCALEIHAGRQRQVARLQTRGPAAQP